MAHRNTVFGQLLTLLPRHEFDAEARGHQRGQRLRVMSRWAQFVALGLGQLASRQSLRDIVSNLRAQPAKLYHLGVGTVSRSSLARVNAEQPYTLYEALFGRLLSRCQQRAPGHGFRFRHKLYAVDASTIDLGRPQFSWTRIKGESDVTRRWGYGSVEGGEGSWVGGDEGSPEGDRSRRRRGGDGVGGLGAGTTVEREPETGCGVAAAAWRAARHGFA